MFSAGLRVVVSIEFYIQRRAQKRQLESVALLALRVVVKPIYHKHHDRSRGGVMRKLSIEYVRPLILQVHRMESLGHEVVPFEDVVCQMWDMLKLGDRVYVTLQVCVRDRLRDETVDE